MSTPTRVYLARLAGVAVFDPNGDQVGPGPRRRGAAAGRPTGRRRWSGSSPRCRCAGGSSCPIGRITSIDADAVVLGTGTLNLRRFEKRPNELLVLEDLLDRRVQLDPGGQPGAVVDVAMECNRSGEWSLTRVAVREQTGRLTRRGHLHQVEWDRGARAQSASPTAQGTANLLAVLEDMRPADLANALQDLPDARRNEVAAALDDERLADVLERAARARPGGDPRRAGPGAGRRRAGGDGPGRRRRPARRAAPAGAGRAARPDGAGRGRPGTPAAEVHARARPAA